MTFAKTSICARYKGVEGWHVFDCDDLPGLYVASRDPATAFNDVAPAIEKLLMLDEGVNCVATPELSIEEFLSSIKGAETAETKHLVMADKRFSVASLIAA